MFFFPNSRTEGRILAVVGGGMFVGCFGIEEEKCIRAKMNGVSFKAAVFWAYLSYFIPFIRNYNLDFFGSWAGSLNHWPKDSEDSFFLLTLICPRGMY